MEKIVISGGTGFVGRHLCERLIEKGYHVAILSRSPQKNSNITTYAWNPEKKEIDKNAIESADYIIHLAGVNIGDERWTPKRKQLIIESRVQTGELILNKIREHNNKLKAFISASAIGYYGAITIDKIFHETDPPSNDFLGETCRLWELSVAGFEKLGVRTVKIRTGVVLSKHGGALPKIMIPINLGIGSPIGNGKQYMPWIHIDDLCGIYIKAIEDSQMNGAYNAVAPEHKTNKDFTEALAHALNKPFFFPNVPGILMEIAFGNMSEMLLYGSRISSDKIRGAGYNFLFPELENALINIFNKP